MAAKPKGRSIGWESSRLIREMAKEKLLITKNDLPLAALVFVEFVLTLIIVAGILLYLDGRFNQLEFPFNLFVFAAIVYAVLHFYNYTRVFRETRGMKRESSLKALLLEFLIFIIIVSAGYIYQDPGVDIAPYPLNLALFILVLIPPVYLLINEKFISPKGNPIIN